MFPSDVILRTFASQGIPILWENRKILSTWFKSIIYPYRNKKIRLSLSYIYKIQIPETNKYLLVRNRRISHQFQPVGGVYKRYGDDHLFNSWEVEWDSVSNGMDVDGTSENDLRFRVQGKYVPAVLKWFEENREREVCASREFQEELLDTNILCAENFRKIQYKHIKRFSKNFSWSRYHNCHEILVFDVMELLPSEAQKVALKKLYKNYKNPPNEFAIVTPEDISYHRIMEKGNQLAKIGEHTNLIINKSF
jgi:hypothetical protein